MSIAEPQPWRSAVWVISRPAFPAPSPFSVVTSSISAAADRKAWNERHARTASIPRQSRPSSRAYRPEPNSIPDSVEDLIGYILERHHQVHRRELPELRNLAIRVEQVHAEHPAVPAGLSDLLAHMQAALELHMQKEEQVLFPLMLAGGNPMIVHPIGMMRHEHDEHGEELRALAALTGDMTPPDGACNSWRALYAGLAKLAEDLTEHIHIENNILFPRFEA